MSQGVLLLYYATLCTCGSSNTSVFSFAQSIPVKGKLWLAVCGGSARLSNMRLCSHCDYISWKCYCTRKQNSLQRKAWLKPAFKEEWERKRVFHFACRAYSFYILISDLFNLKIMQIKRGVTVLDFSLDLLLCMFLKFSNPSIIA